LATSRTCSLTAPGTRGAGCARCRPPA
jgi:hypothetical protein